MGQTDLLRKLIREEVRAVFQEELASILKEAIISNKQPITEAVVVVFPCTLPWVDFFSFITKMLAAKHYVWDRR